MQAEGIMGDVHLGQIENFDSIRNVFQVSYAGNHYIASLSEALSYNPKFTNDLLSVVKRGDSVLLKFRKGMSDPEVIDIYISIMNIKPVFKNLLEDQLIDFKATKIVLQNPQEVILDNGSGKKVKYKIVGNELVKSNAGYQFEESRFLS